MNANLVSYTPDALNLLLRTKNTRLSYDEDPAAWTEEKKKEHLAYMLGTIKSSWEFVDYVFMIEGVTRAFTHELVRTRTGSYAQQSMRVIDARKAPVLMPEGIATRIGQRTAWERAEAIVKGTDGDLIDGGAAVQDARGLLPTNVLTAIMVKFNLRTLHDTAKVRLCTRAAGEYQDVMRAIRTAVIYVHPWAEEFINVQCIAEGTCAFPRYGKTECPVWFPALDTSTQKAEAKRRFWAVRHYAAPKASGGMAMEKEEKA